VPHGFEAFIGRVFGLSLSVHEAARQDNGLTSII
jgi:hypothetical protein